MSILETTVIFGLIPLAIFLALYVFAKITSRAPAPRPAPYRLGQTWTHAPVLWTATDEVTPYTHQAGAAHSGHAELTAGSQALIGGRASGKW
ncbi:aa3-type cytochrome oxidase subunit CtaJ [Rhodococcoides corynebacterioides]|uniref:aa3-type cytochrome oxidase subunit CtaJ n=1 Tax=Rhodococcoides corynebacterioides TaxID=53972 RepID=UPI000832FCCA|nr:hypothetical protein [Rhodococcus corynebacterioides]MBY6349629.1 hypothetical protein [Rhodococcus corynebacterioides]MBY6363415.1 hypothetical protein [Rhodococcus corynebacterioides]